MICVRCGSKMSENDRNCLKCGAINYSHPDNVDYAKKYGNKEEKKLANPNLMKNNIGIFSKILLILMIIIVIFILLYVAGLFTG